MKAVSFGKLSDGRLAGLYILRNVNGMEVRLTDYGATIVSILLPGRDGVCRDVVLGHDDVSGYETGHGSIGAVVGRFANRIGNARFMIGRDSYELTANNGPNALHGGRDPYVKRLWDTKVAFGQISSHEISKYAKESLNDNANAFLKENIAGDSVTFCLDSPDGDQGFPGDLHVEVTYTLTDDNELHLDYSALCNEDTPLNLTNHSYFNLDGHDSGSVLNQLVQINAEKFTPNDEWSLPTGEIRDVAGSPMDFRKAKALGRDIGMEDEQLRVGNGYDHNFVLDGEGYREVASLFSEESGIHMSVLTDLPGMQLYTAHGMSGEPGKDGAVYWQRCSVCFETQFWPDAINRIAFPGGVLHEGERFTSRTTYKFSV